VEKRKAHYPLTKVKRLIMDRWVEFTLTAVTGGAAMGFNANEMLDVVSNLENRNLYKSMTAHADHTVWHASTTQTRHAASCISSSRS
jgi:motility quorum-sensing regulator/GCU-specific mRNA interferase toxin